MTTTAASTTPVVVGVDKSAGSFNALRVAADEAQLRGVDLIVAHVWRFPLLWGAKLTWPEVASPAAHVEQQVNVEIAAMQAERLAAGKDTVQVRVKVIDGDTVPQLRALAANASLLVLGERHHLGPSEVIGSVSHAFAAHPPCPVLIVPAPKR
jgi:nucleotide-binding universal stress UspA family protein